MSTVFLLRHAEKPTGEKNTPVGVTLDGDVDSESLTVRGWQRAGALASFFGPNGKLPMPNHIYASSDQKEKTDEGKVGSKSKRPVETVSVLAQKPNPALKVDTSFAKGEEVALAHAVSALDGVTLICWQHENIPAIAQALAPALKSPTVWPQGRFDIVWHITRDAKGVWAFSQMNQNLLPGDLP